MKLARTKNTYRNTAWGLIYRITTLLGPFAIKTIIIRRLGIEYNGLSSLFTSILTVLNLANLGFSSSLVFMMYKAVVEDDMDSFCALLSYFRKVYKYVGIVILTLGMALMPFLPHLVRGSYPADINLYLLFIIYLAETVLGYLMFAYNEAVFSAYQRNDIILKISTVRFAVQYILQCAVLLIFANYYLYAVLLPIMVIPNNIALYKVARREFPEITCRGTLDEGVKKSIHHRVITLFGHKVGSAVLVSVDSILISAFLNLVTLSIYSNYYYIITAVNAIIEIVTNGSIAGIGNKLMTDSKEENYRTFMMMNYGWVALVGGSAACMVGMYQPFIKIWAGSEYLLSNPLMLLIVFYFYSWMFRIMLLTYRDAAGLWTRDWLKPYVGMVVNLAGSIVMVLITKSIVGVLIPTIFVFFFIYFPWETWAVFKFQFLRSSLQYVVRIITMTVIVIIACGATYLLCNAVSPQYDVGSLILRFIISVLTFGTIWLLSTWKLKERADLFQVLKRILIRN